MTYNLRDMGCIIICLILGMFCGVFSYVDFRYMGIWEPCAQALSVVVYAIMSSTFVIAYLIMHIERTFELYNNKGEKENDSTTSDSN